MAYIKENTLVTYAFYTFLIASAFATLLVMFVRPLLGGGHSTMQTSSQTSSQHDSGNTSAH